MVGILCRLPIVGTAERHLPTLVQSYDMDTCIPHAVDGIAYQAPQYGSQGSLFGFDHHFLRYAIQDNIVTLDGQRLQILGQLVHQLIHGYAGGDGNLLYGAIRGNCECVGCGAGGKVKCLHKMVLHGCDFDLLEQSNGVQDHILATAQGNRKFLSFKSPPA